MIVVAGVVGGLAIYKHRSNIQRLIQGPNIAWRTESSDLLFNSHEGHSVRSRCWGTALAKLLTAGKNQVTPGGTTLTSRDLRRTGYNQALPSRHSLPPAGSAKRLENAVQDAGCIVVAVPSQAFRQVTSAMVDFKGIALSVTKGIEHDRGLTCPASSPPQRPGRAIAALSGPTLALEVARGAPTASVARQPRAVRRGASPGPLS